MSSIPSWSVYIVRCADGSLYTGIALDVERRLAQHRAGRGAKYVRGRGPLELVFERTIGDRGEALRVERALKALPRADKETLVQQPDEYRALVPHSSSSKSSGSD